MGSLEAAEDVMGEVSIPDITECLERWRKGTWPSKGEKYRARRIIQSLQEKKHCIVKMKREQRCSEMFPLAWRSGVSRPYFTVMQDLVRRRVVQLPGSTHTARCLLTSWGGKNMGKHLFWELAVLATSSMTFCGHGCVGSRGWPSKTLLEHQYCVFPESGRYRPALRIFQCAGRADAGPCSNLGESARA